LKRRQVESHEIGKKEAALEYEYDEGEELQDRRNPKIEFSHETIIMKTIHQINNFNLERY
jgi:hypothetical protein